MRASEGEGERNDSVTHAIAPVMVLLHRPHLTSMWERGARARVSEDEGGRRREVKSPR